jgi:hypothetical protein
MKKVIFTVLAASLMLLGTQAFAQVSVNAGYINSTFKAENADPYGANGFYAGATFNIPVAGSFGIAPGVYYSMIASKGFKSGWLGSATGTFTEHAINVPLYLNYGFNLSRDAKFILYGGPTAQYGLSSKTKLDVETILGGIGTVINNYDDKYNYNRLNVYLGGGVGFQAGAFLITVGYDYGMMNQYKGDNATKAHRSNLKLGVGFSF